MSIGLNLDMAGPERQGLGNQARKFPFMLSIFFNHTRPTKMLIPETPRPLQDLRVFVDHLRSGAISISSYRQYRATADALRGKLDAAERVSSTWTQREQQEMHRLYVEADGLIFGPQNGVPAATMVLWDLKSFVEDGDLQVDARLDRPGTERYLAETAHEVAVANPSLKAEVDRLWQAGQAYLCSLV